MVGSLNELRQRAPREVDSAFKGWIADLPCIAHMIEHGRFLLGVQVCHCRISDAEAGWRSVGMAEKPNDRLCTPLCLAHHQGDRRVTRHTQHKMNERLFWEVLGIDIFRLVGDLNFAFDHGRSGRPVIAIHAGQARRRRLGIADG